MWLLALGSLYLLYIIFNPFVYIPDLGKDLPSNIAKARDTYSERVVNEFPIGTSLEKFTQELNDRRFEINPGLQSGNGGGSAVYRYEKFPCSFSLIVKWELDIDDNLSVIQGDRIVTCL